MHEMTTLALANQHALVLAAHHGSHSHGGLLSTFVHAIVAGLGWRAAGVIAHTVGAPILVVGAIVAVLVYLFRQRRSRSRRR